MNFKPVLLECTHVIWNALMADLAKAGRGERESGAFLLGTHSEDRRQVRAWLPYGDVDPPSLNHEIIRLSPDAFPRVWERCRELGMEVVADIHTHPRGPQQSSSDRAYPMISIPGHLALIAPRFAAHNVTAKDVSLNRYIGSGRWESFLGESAAARIQLVTTYEP